MLTLIRINRGLSILIITLLISVSSAILGYWSEIGTPAGIFTQTLGACASGSIVFRDDFEYTDAITNHGWTPISTAGPAQIQSDVVAQGTRALRIDDVSSSSGYLYSNRFPSLQGNFQVDFYARAERLKQSIALQLQGNQEVVDFQIKGIHVELSDSPSSGIRVQNLFPTNYQANKWYHIRLIVRTAQQSFDIYVDDMYSPVQKDIKFADTSFDRVRIGSGTPHTGSGYWDGITVKCLP